MKYTRDFQVNSHDCDADGLMRPTAILREIQECANLSAEAEHPSMDELRAMGYCFVVSRMTVSVYGDLRRFDRLTAETWAAPIGGAFSYGRCYRIVRDGTPLVEASAIFALLDTAHGRPVRAGTVAMHYSADEPLELDIPARLILPPKENFALVAEHTVTRSECDANRHMNNTRYADLLYDYLPASAGERVLRFSLSYLNEAKQGEILKIYRFLGEDGVTFFRTVRADGRVNLEAEIVTE